MALHWLEQQGQGCQGGIQPRNHLNPDSKQAWTLGLSKGPISSLLRLHPPLPGQRQQQAQHDAAVVQGRALPSQEAPATDLSATTSFCSHALSLAQETANWAGMTMSKQNLGPSPMLIPPGHCPGLSGCFGNAPVSGMARLDTSPSLECSAISCGQCW